MTDTTTQEALPTYRRLHTRRVRATITAKSDKVAERIVAGLVRLGGRRRDGTPSVTDLEVGELSQVRNGSHLETSVTIAFTYTVHGNFDSDVNKLLNRAVTLGRSRTASWHVASYGVRTPAWCAGGCWP